MSDRLEVAKASLRTPRGTIWICATARGLREIRLRGADRPNRGEAAARGLRFVRRPRWTDRALRLLERYFAGAAPVFDLPLDLEGGTPFQRRVWEAARRVPYGARTSYGAIAAAVGEVRASRAVGNALAANPVPIVIPCHRVVHGDETLGGFACGLPWKRFLLDLEQGQLELGLKPKRRGLMGRMWSGA